MHGWFIDGDRWAVSMRWERVPLEKVLSRVFGYFTTFLRITYYTDRYMLRLLRLLVTTFLRVPSRYCNVPLRTSDPKYVCDCVCCVHAPRMTRRDATWRDVVYATSRVISTFTSCTTTRKLSLSVRWGSITLSEGRLSFSREILQIFVMVIPAIRCDGPDRLDWGLTSTHSDDVDRVTRYGDVMWRLGYILGLFLFLALLRGTVHVGQLVESWAPSA